MRLDTVLVVLAAVAAAVLIAAPLGAAAAGPVTAKQKRKVADDLVKAGKYAAALKVYSEALELDVTDKMTYYKRALVKMALGRTKHALVDLNAAVEHGPSFLKARFRRSALLTQLGSFANAIADLNAVMVEGTADAAALQEAREKLEEVKSCESLAAAGRAAMAAGQWAPARDRLNGAVECASKDAALRMERARVLMELGETEAAIGDAARASKLQVSSLEPLRLLTELHWKRGDIDDALKHVRECLQSDQSHKGCRALYKVVRAVKKAWDKGNSLLEARSYADAAAKFEFAVGAADLPPVYLAPLNLALARALRRVPSRRADAVAACAAALAESPTDLQVLLLKAELHIEAEDYEPAVHTLNEAKRAYPRNQNVANKLGEAQRLLKISLRVDYYKILGVSKSASEKDVVRAYRKLARQWHPDKWKTEAEKAKAEKMFKDIATGKEILTDPEKRAIYDRGDDPFDENAGRRGGGGFPGGGFPFGSTTFTFRT